MGGLYETLSGAKGLRAEGKSAQNIEEYNAQVAEQTAKAIKLRSGFDQMQQAKEAERIKSTIASEIGAAGGAGSPVAIDIKKEQAAESELEMLLIGYEGEVGAQRQKSQATLSRLQGQLAKQKGKNAARRANIQFGMELAALAMGTGGFKKPSGKAGGTSWAGGNTSPGFGAPTPSGTYYT